MIQCRRVELNELHVFYSPFGTVNHRDTIAGSHQRIGGSLVNSSDTTCRYQGHFRKECIDPSVRIHDVSTVAFYIRRLAGDGDTQMVLRQYFNCKMIFKDSDVRMLLDRLYQAVLYLGTRIILMVKDAEFGMAAFTMQVEVPFFIFIEIDTPADQLFDLLRSVAHNLFNSIAIAEPVARNHCIFNMFIEVIDDQVCHRGDTPLCEICVSFFQISFAYQGNFPFTGYFKCETHSCNTGTYH